MDKWSALLNASAPHPVPLENCHQGGLVPGQVMPGQTCAPVTIDGSGRLDCPYSSFRVSDDIYNHWPFVINNINALVPYLDQGGEGGEGGGGGGGGGSPAGSPKPNNPALSRPGQWAYPDMLEVGQLLFATRYVTRAFSLFY